MTVSNPMSEWSELAPGILVRRHTELDLTVGLVVGTERCLLIDTRGSLAHGHELAAAIPDVTPLPPSVVLTHAHFDHAFGAAAFVDHPIWAHTRCRTALADHGTQDRREWTDRYRHEGRHDLADDLTATPITKPTHTFDHTAELDLGGRVVELVHPGRGHTDHDVLVVADDIVFAGDLVEHEPGGSFTAESFGPDTSLDSWPAALDAILARTPRVVVPGHGEPVDTAFVQRAQGQLRALADLRNAVRAGTLSAADAVAASPLSAQATRAALA